ncbi:WhiB family transcriptional regulator [Streptomyces sp. NPDC029674]|uniref:WhiB family transcriptional regulator n=1 Tax=Streptomyces sp. NPDC029674 TaxID=3365297 RepID=UPI00384FB39F
MEWPKKAACTEEDPDLFFPVGTTGPAARETAAAKQICAHCEVRVQCLAWALEAGETGVWGGTCTEERADLRRKTRWSRSARSARASRTAPKTRRSH